MQYMYKTLILSVLFFTSGCSSADFVGKENENSSKNTMIKLNNIQNWCVGRYTFQIPKEASPIGAIDKYNSFIIKSQINKTHDDLVTAYQEQLKIYSVKTTKILKDTPEQKIGNKVIKIFKAKYGTDNRGANDVYAWVLDNKTLFSISGTYSLEFQDKSEEALNNILNNLSARNNASIPKIKGVCIDNGFIANSGQPFRHSLHTMGFTFPKFPSVRIALESEATLSAHLNLIDRMTDNLKQTGNWGLFSSKQKTIKKGSRKQSSGNYLSGDEWIFEMPMQGKPGLLASFEYAGKPRDALDTLVHLEVDTAYKSEVNKTTSIPQPEAIQLYDIILNSIKTF